MIGKIAQAPKSDFLSLDFLNSQSFINVNDVEAHD